MAQVARPAGVGVRIPAPARSRSSRVSANAWLWRLFLVGVALLLFGPILLLFLFAFNDSNILAFPLEGFTVKWFGEAFDDRLLRQALLNSFGVAFIVAPVCLVLGTLAAFGVTRFRFRGRGAISGLIGAPLVLPWLVIGIAALMFYVRVDVSLNLRTVVATQVICTFPLVTAIVAAQLFRFEKVQEEAAIDLGCSRVQVLRHIVLPHIGPALGAAAIFAFTWSFNNYEISAFTIGFQQTFPVWVYSNVRNPEHTAIVNAISTLISVVQVAMIGLAVWLLRTRGGDAALVQTETFEAGARH